MSGMELRQGKAWPSFGECKGVFISFKLFSPADGHPSDPLAEFFVHLNVRK